MSQIYHFTVPLPPEILRPNGRGSWGAKQGAAKRYTDDVGKLMYNQILAVCPTWRPEPRPHGRLHAKFICRGAAPDPDNRVGILKPIIDLLQLANGRTGKRYRLGIITDDRGLDVMSVDAVAHDRSGSESVIELTLEVWN